ncbi:cytochrome P450 [Rhizodiscina lignyota]|uniref:Cytochrome P450 n=1 Tax=Rhizodiscina lignyota TaxID=1504668 RepID=A0A9P4IDE1_9PEZI|nr:cytochrome P450 [Rhizodiscina lignyota]
MYPPIVIIGSFLVVLLGRLVYNHFRLLSTGIKGPFVASLTNAWRASKMRQPFYAEYVYSLHQKYGKLVRLGPRYVSVADPAAIPIIYGTRPVWIKADSYHPLMSINKGKVMPSIVSTVSEDYFTKLRKGVGNAFATYTLLDYEKYLEESSEEVLDVFRKKQGARFDMIPWLFFYTMDAMSRIAFSETPAFVSSGTDVGNSMAAISSRFEYWAKWAALPALEKLIHKNLLVRMAASKGSPLAEMAASKIRARKTATQPLAQKDLLAKFMDAAEKHPDTISSDSVLSLVISTIAAGGDTTAVTLSATIYYLLKNPSTYDKVMEELKAAAAAGKLSDSPLWNEVNVLPYLDAVLKETLRCYPIGQFSIDRIVPKGGATIAGTFLPEGTVVGCQQVTMHQDKEVFGKDVETFRPERWLEATDEQRKKMEKTFLGFSTGKRICIGMHIAQMEWKKFIPHLLMNFKVMSTLYGCAPERTSDSCVDHT